MAKTKVAIDGMPSPRPRCAYCRKELRFLTNDTWEPADRTLPGALLVRRTFAFWLGYPNAPEPLFDTLRCALAFAVLAHKVGFRGPMGGQ